jgi:hypothetical protein
MSTSYEVPHYAAFFNLPSLPLFGPNILLSTLFSNTSVYVPPLISETKSDNHTEPQAKL